MKLLKKLFISFEIVCLLFFSGPFQIATAQEASSSAQQTTPSASDSATATADVTPTPTPIPVVDRTPADTDNVFSNNKIALPQPNFDTPQTMVNTIKPPLSIKQLDKHDYRLNESVNFTIENATDAVATIRVTDTNDATVGVSMQRTVIDNAIVGKVTPPFGVAPGRYFLEASDSDGQVAKVEFTWGEIVMNMDKSVYTPGETVGLSFAISDDQGNISCDASLAVTITDPAELQTTISTTDGSITTKPACKEHGASVDPDYAGHFTVPTVGTYTLSLKAHTADGDRTITERLLVRDTVPFSVQRSMPTRIDTSKPFPVSLTITANQDFTGTIRDIVPDDFVITPSTESARFVQTASTSASQRAHNVSSGIPTLRVPFDGDYPLSLDFGGEIQDPLWIDVYRQFGLLGHDGLDFAMPIGTPLKATDAGVVTQAGPGDYGTTIVIEHSWGKSYYGHLSEVAVTEGQSVSRGMVIGKSGNSGIATGPHLHFGIKPANPDMENGYYGKVDPLPYLGLTSDSQILTAQTSSDQLPVKLSSWEVAMQKGDTTTLTYMLKAPERSPAAAFIGPVQFATTDGTTETTQFSEIRFWQTVAEQTKVLGASTFQEDYSKIPMQSLDPDLLTVPDGFSSIGMKTNEDIDGQFATINLHTDSSVVTFNPAENNGTKLPFSFAIQDANTGDVQSTANSLTKKDLFRNVDAQYTTYDGYLDQVLTLKNAQARREFTLHIDKSDKLVMDDINQTAGHIVLRDKNTDEEVLSMRFPQGIDASNQRIDYAYRIDGDNLVLYPKRAWQFERAVFPIRIFAPVNTIAWDEAEVQVGDDCPETDSCMKDGDIKQIKPVGWHWGVKALKQSAIVRMDKIKKQERDIMEATTIDETERKEHFQLPVNKLPKDAQDRMAAKADLKRFGFDYTQIAGNNLQKLRDRNKGTYAPKLDARRMINAIKKKSNPLLSMIPTERHLAYKAPGADEGVFARIMDFFVPKADAVTCTGGVCTSTIGSAAGRDFATPAAWESARQGTLTNIEVGDMYNDSTFTAAASGNYVSISGWTVTSSFYPVLEGAPGERHTGTAGTGAKIDCNGENVTGGVSGISAQENFIQVLWLEITRCRNASGAVSLMTNIKTGIVFAYDLIYNYDDATNAISAIRTSSTTGAEGFTAFNDIIYDADNYGIRGNGDTLEALTISNCTIYGTTQYGIDEKGATMTIKNTIAMNNTTKDINTIVNGSQSNNMTSDATGTGQPSKSISTQFVSTTLGSEDFHLVNGSDAINNGTTLSGVPDDIDGDARPDGQTYDIGADEFPSPALIDIMRHGKYFDNNGDKHAFTF